jgi:hypothetical protein
MVCSLVSNAGKPTFCGLKRFFAFKYNCMDEMNECMNVWMVCIWMKILRIGSCLWSPARFWWSDQH